MSITYPPEMLPTVDEGEKADVIVCCGEKCCAEENARLRSALRDILAFDTGYGGAEVSRAAMDRAAKILNEQKGN